MASNFEDIFWYQNPPMSTKPENIRSMGWSVARSREGLYTETEDLPQQTAGAGNITMDLSSKISVGGYQNNSKTTFDLQSNNFSFVFENQNINNYDEVPPAVQDAINNNTPAPAEEEQQQPAINYYLNTSGFTGSVTSLSNPQWSNTNMTITFTSVTSVFNNGLIASVTNNASVVVTLSKLLTLSNWYESADEGFSLVQQVADVNITGNNLVQETYDWTFDHGLLLVPPAFHSTDTISPLTDCP